MMKNAHSRWRPKKAPALARCDVKQSDSDSDFDSDFDLIPRDRPRSDLSFFGAAGARTFAHLTLTPTLTLILI